jgi:hypothetical protein
LLGAGRLGHQAELGEDVGQEGGQVVHLACAVRHQGPRFGLAEVPKARLGRLPPTYSSTKEVPPMYRSLVIAFCARSSA